MANSLVPFRPPSTIAVSKKPKTPVFVTEVFEETSRTVETRPGKITTTTKRRTLTKKRMVHDD